jgi:hypothetical protein
MVPWYLMAREPVKVLGQGLGRGRNFCERMEDAASSYNFLAGPTDWSQPKFSVSAQVWFSTTPRMMISRLLRMASGEMWDAEQLEKMERSRIQLYQIPYARLWLR